MFFESYLVNSNMKPGLETIGLNMTTKKPQVVLTLPHTKIYKQVVVMKMKMKSKTTVEFK